MELQQNESKSPRLTQTVQKGGCAAKVAAVELRKILSQVEFPPKPANLQIDAGTFDDAAVVRLTDTHASIHTLDFFTPIVDTPRIFGRISATNALSDIYAMGGEPEVALAILAFPLSLLPQSVAVDVLQGACDALKEAGAALVGGHSIDDDTLKFGLSVTGRAHPDRIWSNAAAQSGDHLILTKALGTGTLTAGLKRNEWTEADLSEAIASMSQLNRIKDLLAEDQLTAIHAATDITGFGLLGHLQQMALASQVRLRLKYDSLPWLPKAKESLKKGFLTKAHRTNNEYTRELCRFSEVLLAKFDHELQIVWDPQTSGGLCLAVSPERSAAMLKQLQKRFPSAQIIGEVFPATQDGNTILVD